MLHFLYFSIFIFIHLLREWWAASHTVVAPLLIDRNRKMCHPSTMSMSIVLTLMNILKMHRFTHTHIHTSTSTTERDCQTPCSYSNKRCFFILSPIFSICQQFRNLYSSKRQNDKTHHINGYKAFLQWCVWQCQIGMSSA